MERYSFLSNQHDDLVRAEETLQGIITDLDTAMRNQFHENLPRSVPSLTRYLRNCSVADREHWS